mgnify:CR=1 FL=1
MFSSRVMRSIAKRPISSLWSRYSDVSHSVNRDVLTDLALLKERVRLGRNDAAIRDGDQCLRSRLVPRCRQLLLRYAEDRTNGTEGIDLVGKAEDTKGLTVLKEPSQDAKVRLKIQRLGCADDVRSLERRGWRMESNGKRLDGL